MNKQKILNEIRSMGNKTKNNDFLKEMACTYNRIEFDKINIKEAERILENYKFKFRLEQDIKKPKTAMKRTKKPLKRTKKPKSAKKMRRTK